MPTAPRLTPTPYTDGTRVTTYFDRGVAVADGSGWAYRVNGGGPQPLAAAGDRGQVIPFTPGGTPVAAGDVVEIRYAPPGGTAGDPDGTELEAFDWTAVANNVAPPPPPSGHAVGADGVTLSLVFPGPVDVDPAAFNAWVYDETRDAFIGVVYVSGSGGAVLACVLDGGTVGAGDAVRLTVNAGVAAGGDPVTVAGALMTNNSTQ